MSWGCCSQHSASNPWFLCDPMVVQTVALLYKNRFARRGWDTRSEKTGERVRVRHVRDRTKRETKREKRDRVSKKRFPCIQCKRRRETNLSGWARGFCITHAQDAECTFPQERKKVVKQNKKVVQAKKERRSQVRVKKEAKVTLWPRGVVHSGYGKLNAEQEADTEMDTDSHDDKDLQAGKAGGEAGGEVFVEAHAAGSEEAKEAEDSEEEEEEDEDDSKSVRSDTTYYTYVPKSWDLSPAASGSVFFQKRPHPRIQN